MISPVNTVSHATTTIFSVPLAPLAEHLNLGDIIRLRLTSPHFRRDEELFAQYVKLLDGAVSDHLDNPEHFHAMGMTALGVHKLFVQASVTHSPESLHERAALATESISNLPAESHAEAVAHVVTTARSASASARGHLLPALTYNVDRLSEEMHGYAFAILFHEYKIGPGDQRGDLCLSLCEATSSAPAALRPVLYEQLVPEVNQLNSKARASSLETLAFRLDEMNDVYASQAIKTLQSAIINLPIPESLPALARLFLRYDDGLKALHPGGWHELEHVIHQIPDESKVQFAAELRHAIEHDMPHE